MKNNNRIMCYFTSDPEILAEVVKWREGVLDLYNEKIGRSHVLLEGRREYCRVEECNLGKNDKTSFS